MLSKDCCLPCAHLPRHPSPLPWLQEEEEEDVEPGGIEDGPQGAEAEEAEEGDALGQVRWAATPLGGVP